MKKKHYLCDGGITVFFSLVILIIIVLISTVLESARVSIIQSRTRKISEISLDSCFAGYAREIYEDYGLLVLWEKDEELISKFSKYANKNSCIRDNNFGVAGDILKINFVGVDIQNKKSITDCNGEIAYEQIYSYMKYKIAEDGINALINKTQSLSQGEEVNRQFDNINNCSDSIIKVEKSVETIKENTEKLLALNTNFIDQTILLKKYIEDIKNINNKIDEANEKDQLSDMDKENYKQEKNTIFEGFKGEYYKYFSNFIDAKDYLKNISNKTEKFKEHGTDAKSKIDNAKLLLNNSKDVIDEEIYNIINDGISGLEKQVVDFKQDSYGVYETEKIIIPSYNTILEVSDITEDLSSVMEGVERNYLKLSDFEYNTDNYRNINFINNTYNTLCRMEEKFKSFNLDGININYSISEVKKEDNSILDFIDNLVSEGILGVVTSNEISNKKVDKSSLVENIAVRNKNYSWKGMSAYDLTVKKALIGQYILDVFLNYVNTEKKGKLDYEVEYIIGGKNNDKDNLSYVVNRIILIREGFNLVYLFKDKTKMQEANALAVSLVGFTGMPAIVKITQLLILAAWSYGESVIDLRDLLQGKKVSLIKNSDEWNLSLEGVKNLKEESKSKSKNSGLGYSDYLRFLLFSSDREEQIFRILSLIELNISRKYNPNFKICDCIVEAQISAKYSASSVFTAIPFVNQSIKYKKDNFIFTTYEKYGY